MNARERQVAVEAHIASSPRPWIDRVSVVESCGSTQDEACQLAAGRPGLLVSAVEQTAGRGRLGRAWIQRAGLGLAATFVLDANSHEVETLPTRVGCAVCDACERLIHAPNQLGVKWPNDVVSRRGLRKLSGVLIDRRGDLLLVGIGINLLQASEDWPLELRDRTVSVSQLGVLGHGSIHARALCQLIDSLDHWLFIERELLIREFASRDVLVGSIQTLEHDGARFSGIIENIEPWGSIAVRTDRERVLLPCASTSIVKD